VALLVRRANPFAVALQEALAGFGESGVLALEVALDRKAFAEAFTVARIGGEDGRILRSLFETWVDLTNIATLLKVAEPAQAAEFLLPGGAHTSEERHRDLASLPRTALPDVLDAWAAPLVGRAGIPKLASPPQADLLLSRALARGMRRLARAQPLSIAVPLSFVLDRQAEVRRIELVLRGTDFGLPAEELLELLEV
jgi:V/A-type H+-transporting ATPase subunit C